MIPRKSDSESRKSHYIRIYTEKKHFKVPSLVSYMYENYSTISFYVSRDQYLPLKISFLNPSVSFNIFTCRVVRATKMTGSSSDDWNYWIISHAVTAIYYYAFTIAVSVTHKHL
jgi:hypothetical protein